MTNFFAISWALGGGGADAPLTPIGTSLIVIEIMRNTQEILQQKSDNVKKPFSTELTQVFSFMRKQYVYWR